MMYRHRELKLFIRTLAPYISIYIQYSKKTTLYIKFCLPIKTKWKNTWNLSYVATYFGKYKTALPLKPFQLKVINYILSFRKHTHNAFSAYIFRFKTHSSKHNIYDFLLYVVSHTKSLVHGCHQQLLSIFRHLDQTLTAVDLTTSKLDALLKQLFALGEFKTRASNSLPSRKLARQWQSHVSLDRLTDHLRSSVFEVERERFYSCFTNSGVELST